MLEVEAKVPITKGDYLRLRRKFRALGLVAEQEKKDDEYYGAVNEKTTLRIRKSENYYAFDIKKRTVTLGVESNVEMTWKLKEASVWKKVLSKIGLKPSIRKHKISEVYWFKDFRIELNHVQKLGFYLEIEVLLKTKRLLIKKQKELIQLFQQLGYAQNQFESKPYLELLSNV